MRRNAQLILSGVTSAATLLVSGWQPFERAPWLLEIFPVLIALPVIAITRNPYDKIGHLMQGFVPALVAREIFMRGGYVTGRKMTAFLCICTVIIALLPTHASDRPPCRAAMAHRPYSRYLTHAESASRNNIPNH